MSGTPDLLAGAGELRELLSRLQAVIEAKDTENAVLRAELDAERELRRRLELKVARGRRQQPQRPPGGSSVTQVMDIHSREDVTGHTADFTSAGSPCP